MSVDGSVATSTTYDADNNVTSLTSGNVTTNFNQRDKDGNITSQTDNTGSQSFGYNNDDVLTSRAFTVGTTTTTLTKQRNNEVQLTAILDGSKSLATYGYNQNNQVETVKLGNGLSAMYSYDGDHRIQTLTINGSTGVILAYKYTYDSNGNITSIKNLQTGQDAYSYTYDNLNRLLTETEPDGTTISYNYDESKNTLNDITSKSVTKNGTTTTTTYGFSSSTGNELKSVNGQSYTYDTNGNLKNDGTYSYNWNELGQLTEVDNASTGAVVATFTYDGAGRRASKTVGGATTNYYYEGESNLVAYETDSSGTLLRSYTYNDQNQPVTMTTWSGGTGTTYYYHLNGHGDVIAMTDSSENIVAQYSYDAWGNILSRSGSMASTNPYRYAGYRWDNSIGLYYLNARYYSPSTMRFISRDPVNKSPNLYMYANNNPVINVDPSGESSGAEALAAFESADLSLDWSPVGWVLGVGGVVVVGAWDIYSYAKGLPPKEVAKNDKGVIEHNYNSGDHGPPHVHVTDKKGKTTKVGQNGKPLEGSPELNRDQRELVKENLKKVRKAVRQIGKWYRNK